MAKKLDMRSPFPSADVLPLQPDGRWNRAWLEFMLTQYRRTGDAPGIDTAALKARVDELEMLLNSDTTTAVLAALLQRVAMLEAFVISMPVPMPARAAAGVLPDPVAVPTRAASQLPEPVPAAPRAPDDIRKLIEA
ncbi:MULTISPECIES: hypothetical protein [Burkholderia]|uniref:Uncharacterized protein n=1 Tax=Burkholderia contaminans TaxID=488447 RepID=A0A2S5DRG4_9BURK|nr:MULTISPECIES: hypothetical protein [Burkholderia]EKS9798234.1 hypothetical protein [Burkholderia cepacia]EKS9808381.1 hypothetical protein [Burkholderia cepacia]EKS9815991.1 hypothetical protein [Burkholderia cepacia]EKS9823585.1 hypothetical protein [Burkholderia cepacia]EKS9827313.1 hypothetical protein [Burkholderia cepacia]